MKTEECELTSRPLGRMSETFPFKIKVPNHELTLYHPRPKLIIFS